MISTENHLSMPDRKTVQAICKAISVMDAILSPEWEYRYYSYNSEWAEEEEFCEMRNGEGDQMLILFRKDGCVINGFAHEFEQPHISNLTANLPKQYEEFIFGEPIKSIGTTFCLWTNASEKWQIGELKSYDDNSIQMLSVFDGNPQTYIDWATEYFEGVFNKNGIPLEVVTKLYKGEPLTKEMVLSVVNELEDWDQLEVDLEEIKYPYDFK